MAEDGRRARGKIESGKEREERDWKRRSLEGEEREKEQMERHAGIGSETIDQTEVNSGKQERGLES